MSDSKFMVTATYPSELISQSLDEGIESAAGKEADFSGSGTGVLKHLGRELGWWVADIYEAQTLAKRLRTAQIPNVRVTMREE